MIRNSPGLVHCSSIYPRSGESEAIMSAANQPCLFAGIDNKDLISCADMAYALHPAREDCPFSRFDRIERCGELSHGSKCCFRSTCTRVCF